MLTCLRAGNTPAEGGISRTASSSSIQQSEAVVRNQKMAMYRHAAKGGFMGGGARGKSEKLTAEQDMASTAGMPVFIVESDRLSVLETVGMAKLVVMRLGVTDVEATVNFATRDGTAKGGLHYESLDGSLVFAPGETEHEVFVKIIHDEQYNEDLTFSINLSVEDTTKAKMGRMNSCEVTIIDMDGPGIFEWAEENVQQRKSTDSKAPLLLTRNKGATGEVYVKVRTVDGTAKAGEHFEALDEDVFFKNNVTTKPVRVQLIKFDKPDDAGDDYSVSFFVDIAEADKDKAGGATLGNVTRVEVRIEYAEEDDGDGIMTFTDQFRQAMMVNGGEDGGEAGCVDMTMHYISITWKILAATVPPTHIWGGWATFWFSMSLVGIVTGIIGDIATVFGCIVGLDNEITGIFLVALGTSLPGERHAACAATSVLNVHVLTY
jgi:solute carrier family 8 (sodium/calcium exchanger)